MESLSPDYRQADDRLLSPRDSDPRLAEPHHRGDYRFSNPRSSDPRLAELHHLEESRLSGPRDSNPRNTEPFHSENRNGSPRDTDALISELRHYEESRLSSPRNSDLRHFEEPRLSHPYAVSARPADLRGFESRSTEFRQYEADTASKRSTFLSSKAPSTSSPSNMETSGNRALGFAHTFTKDRKMSFGEGSDLQTVDDGAENVRFTTYSLRESVFATTAEQCELTENRFSIPLI